MHVIPQQMRSKEQSIRNWNKNEKRQGAQNTIAANQQHMLYRFLLLQLLKPVLKSIALSTGVFVRRLLWTETPMQEQIVVQTSQLTRRKGVGTERVIILHDGMQMLRRKRGQRCQGLIESCLLCLLGGPGGVRRGVARLIEAHNLVRGRGHT